MWGSSSTTSTCPLVPPVPPDAGASDCVTFGSFGEPQTEREGGAATLLAHEPQAAPAKQHDAAAQVQADAHTSGLVRRAGVGPVEALEHAPFPVGWNADPTVLD